MLLVLLALLVLLESVVLLYVITHANKIVLRCCATLVLMNVDLLLLSFRAPLELREIEERLVRLEREDTRDTEASLACRVCPDLL